MTLLCHTDDIAEGESKSLDLGEWHSFFAVKRDDQIHVYRNSCPHLGVELNWQEDKFLDMDGQLIQCFTHGALFTVESGECLAGPCQGEYLEKMPIEIRGGEVHLLRDPDPDSAN